MSLFRRKRPSASPPAVKLVEARNGDERVLVLLDEAAGTTALFPAVNLLLRSAEDQAQITVALLERGAGDDDLPWSEPAGSGLFAVLGLDEGDRHVTLTRNALAARGLTAELARAGALARLRMAVGGLLTEGGAGQFRLHLRSEPDLTASFMLVADSWLELDRIDGPPVFAAGTRAFLHVCGANDPDAVEGLRHIAETSHRDGLADPQTFGRALTPTLQTLQSNRLVPFHS